MLNVMDNRHITPLKVVLIHFLAISFALLFDSSFGFSLRPGYALAIYLLLVTTASRKSLFLIVVTALSAMSSIYAPISFLYGPPNINILLSIAGSNAAESFEFLALIPVKYYLYSALIIAAGLLLILNPNLLSVKRNKITLFLFFTIVLFRPVYSAAKHGEIDFDFTPIKFVNKFHSSAVRVKEENARLKELIKVKTSLSPTKASDEFDTYIIVIGESARRDFMGAYGFAINNTPFMSSANGTIFENYISAASSTQTSLSTDFTVQGKPQDNIIRLAQAQGLETWWISNQGSYGNDDSQVSFIGKQADQQAFIKKGEYDATNHDDRELLPYIKIALQANTKKKLIVVHLMGSHPNFCTRTANQYDTFYVNDSLSCYAQSIKNTDGLLSSIAQTVSDEHKKWTMMYFSDHGLSFVNNTDKKNITMIHGDKTKQNYTVPLFITSYNATQRVVKSFPYSAMDFLSLYLYWTGSTEKQIHQTCNPLAMKDCTNSNIQVIDFNHRIRPFSSLVDEPIPLALP